VLSAGLGGAGTYTRGESSRGVLSGGFTLDTLDSAGQSDICTLDGTLDGPWTDPGRTLDGTRDGHPAGALPRSGTSVCAPLCRCVVRCRPFGAARGEFVPGLVAGLVERL